jgi:hypothetical protein
MKMDPRWEAASLSHSQAIPKISFKVNMRNRLHKGPFPP